MYSQQIIAVWRKEVKKAEKKVVSEKDQEEIEEEKEQEEKEKERVIEHKEINLLL